MVLGVWENHVRRELTITNELTLTSQDPTIEDTVDIRIENIN